MVVSGKHMKRTELERKERELKKQEKKISRIAGGESAKKSVNEYIEQLFSLLRYDQNELFNTTDDVNILELLEEMKNDLPESQWENVIKKAIKKTKISGKKEEAIQTLKDILSF